MGTLYAPNPNDLAATTLTDIYTCPAGVTVKISAVFANRAATPTTIRLSLAVDGAADDLGQYLLYGVALPANTTIIVDGITIQHQDVVRAWAADADVSANVLIEEMRTLTP